MKRYLIALTILLFACGKSSGDSDGDKPVDVDHVMTGKINGKEWTFAAGRATEPSKAFEDQINWNFDLISDTREDVCNGFVLRGEDNLTVIFDAEPKVGKHSLGMNDNVTLYDGADNGNLNIIATDGYYELTSVTATEISGVIVAKHDGDSTVTGTFTATRCCLDDTGFNYLACTE